MDNKKLNDSILERVIGGVKPELHDGEYRLQCENCGVWIKGSSAEDCLNRYAFHQRGECCYSVII